MKTITPFLLILLTSSLLLPVISRTNLDGCILYMPFNGNANDESGNGNNGILTGATLATDRNGNEHSACYFDGKSYITVKADDSVLNVNPTGFTFSFWVKPDKNQVFSHAPLVSFGYGSAGGYNVTYWEQYGMFKTSFYDYSWTGKYISKDELDEYVWYMYTFTYDGHALKQYVNGVYINQTTTSYYPASPPGTYTLKFGAESRYVKEFFKGFIDDIRIYNRALTDLEIASLSGFSGAVRATELNAYSLADFELGTLRPIKYSNYWAVWGNNGNAFSKVVENPVKSGSNISKYVGVAVTFPSSVAANSDCDKSEYVLTSAKGLADDHHHIMKWKLLLVDSSILKIETILWDWMYFNQIHTGCEKYPGGNGDPEPSIAYSGGIFNDLGKKSQATDPSIYNFRIRAMPDSARVDFNINIGQWMSFTYEVFWTHSDTGYWSLWKDGQLLGSAANVKTLPDCCDEDDNFLHFKTGLYNKWNDPEIDSLPLFFDDIELYIGDNINVKEVCPECYTNLQVVKPVKPDLNILETMRISPNPASDVIYFKGIDFPFDIKLFTIYGRLVLQNKDIEKIDISALPSGFYILSTSKNNLLKSVIFVKL